MSDENSFEMNVNFKNLDRLIKAFEKPSHVKVGIVGEKNSRGELQGNAEIGVRHEFGTETLPKRSFLREPLIDNLYPMLILSEALDDDVISQVLQEGDIDGWMKRVGAVCEETIAEGFKTGGFGKWKESNMSQKTNHETLVESQQLRDSIAFRVEAYEGDS